MRFFYVLPGFSAAENVIDDTLESSDVDNTSPGHCVAKNWRKHATSNAR